MASLYMLFVGKNLWLKHFSVLLLGEPAAKNFLALEIKKF